ncbi:uncharacterized protein LOC107269813 isoform X1 [Cephus cinctus]|uniref:Uncharacterized protein LOC107269813 isoform X1 n=1 Tax=Cephus cinctus TaxID=211228 RepID=A0AAJ7FMU0_CEPCN|nr:uncharacterized protein LOC107269813 isoform X1 [Cephus cinctus]
MLINNKSSVILIANNLLSLATFIVETRRRQVVEAAEKRRIEEERRGIGNLEAVRVQQQLDEERARRRAEDLNIDPQTGMKWQVN